MVPGGDQSLARHKRIDVGGESARSSNHARKALVATSDPSGEKATAPISSSLVVAVVSLRSAPSAVRHTRKPP
jgi:hypothetical protein